MGTITNICLGIYSAIQKIIMWLDGKKTAIGGLFFVIKDVIIEPYFTRFHGTMPAQLDFWLGVIATLFTLVGVTHATVKGVQARRLKKMAAMNVNGKLDA